MNTCRKISENENLSANEPTTITVKDVIAMVAPAFVARYVTHQARVCQQAESEIDNSLRIYLNQLESSAAGSSDGLTVGDLWSGLLWWRDEASWVGKTGVFSLVEVTQLAASALRAYLSMRDSGRNSDEISQLISNDTQLPHLARKLVDGLQCDGAAPGFRSIVSYAVCQLGATIDG
jgi:hypothetical protein